MTTEQALAELYQQLSRRTDAPRLKEAISCIGGELTYLRTRVQQLEEAVREQSEALRVVADGLEWKP